MSFKETWDKAMEIFQKNNYVIYSVYFSDVVDASLDGNTVTLVTTSEFKKALIVNSFADTILPSLKQVLGFTPELRIVSKDDKSVHAAATKSRNDYDEWLSRREKLENEGISYMQLAERRMDNHDKAGAIEAYRHAYECMSRVGYKPDDFHYKTVESLKDIIDKLEQDIQI